jgi:hypothetical protein
MVRKKHSLINEPNNAHKDKIRRPFLGCEGNSEGRESSRIA